MTKTGVVLQIEKSKAILMTASGEFVKVKISAKAPKAGETYTGTMYKENNLIKYAAAVACLLILFLSGGGAYAYYSPVATVKVSINPSLELKLNRFNRIISYTSLNKDGEKLISHLSIKNTTIDEGLQKIVEEAKKENFINDNYIKDGRIISIGITSKGKTINIQLSKFEKYISDNNLKLDLNNNGKEIKLNNKNIEQTKKEIPLTNEKDKTPQSNNSNSNEKTINNNSDNNKNNNNKNNNKNNSNINNDSNINSNNSKDSDNSNSNSGNSNKSKEIHPSDNSGNNGSDTEKTKKK